MLALARRLVLERNCIAIDGNILKPQKCGTLSQVPLMLPDFTWSGDGMGQAEAGLTSCASKEQIFSFALRPYLVSSTLELGFVILVI